MPEDGAMPQADGFSESLDPQVAEENLVKDLAGEMYLWAIVDGMKLMAIKPSYTLGQVSRAITMFHRRQQRVWADFHLMPGEPSVSFVSR